MRNNKLVVRRNVRGTEQALVESIMAKIAPIVKKALIESLDTPMQEKSLVTFMRTYYNNDETCIDALNKLTDEQWLHNNGWFQVFHKGIGDGVYSPSEKIVAVFDEDDLPEYHSYQLYRYNPKAWVSVENDGWNDVYSGNNGSGHEAELID